MAASLTAAGQTSDVYDFDTQGRKAPHHLGVLSHYKTVAWETGDDIIPRSTGQVGGTAAKAALDLELSVRDYLNEGGKLHAERQVRALRPGRQRRVLLQPVRPAGVHHATGRIRACRCSTTSSSTGSAPTPTCRDGGTDRRRATRIR